jgi:glycerol-3-phosphate acyltransferase PlsY
MNEMVKQEMAPQRPVIITVICIIGFVGAGLSVLALAAWGILSRTIGAWYPPFLLVATGVGLACMLGMWQMRKWSVFLYTAFVVINQVVMIVFGVWNPMSLLIPLAVVIIGFTQLSKMR